MASLASTVAVVVVSKGDRGYGDNSAIDDDNGDGRKAERPADHFWHKHFPLLLQWSLAYEISPLPLSHSSCRAAVAERAAGVGYCGLRSAISSVTQ